jgi:hypothetical protein
MRKNLSSNLTFTYKFILPFIWTGTIGGLTIFIYLDSGDWRTFFVLLMILPVIILFKIKLVSFDNDHIFISNGRTEKTYNISNLKSINEPYNFTDPFFEIELIGENGRTEKFEFMARLEEQLSYVFSGQITGRLLELKNKKEIRTSN